MQVHYTFRSQTGNTTTSLKLINYGFEKFQNDFLQEVWSQLCHQISRSCCQQAIIHTVHESCHVRPNATQQEWHSAMNNKWDFFNFTFFPKMRFFDQAGQNKLYPKSSQASPMQAMFTEPSITIALQRPKCGTSTSTRAVLEAWPVTPSTRAWDACNVSQCWSSMLLEFTTRWDAPESRAQAPLANCAMVCVTSTGTSNATPANFCDKNSAKAFVKASFAPNVVAALLLLPLLLLLALLPAKPGGGFKAALAAAFDASSGR